MLSLVVLSLLVASTTSQQSSCRLSDVITVPNLNETALAGSWYETRWYYSDNDEPYENYAMSIVGEPELPGVFVTEYIRYPPAAKCSVYNAASRVRRENSVYEYYLQEKAKYVQSYIVYTDYDRYLTELICQRAEGDMCTQPEVALYFRLPVTRSSSVSPYPENIEEHLRKYNLDRCVDTSKFMSGTSREPPCTPVTHPLDGTVGPRPTRRPVPPIRECLMDRVMGVENLDERRLEGMWHEIRWYMIPDDRSVEYDSYQLEIKVDPQIPGLRIKEHLRKSRDEACRIENEANRRRLSTGGYEFYRSDLEKYVQSHILYLDDRYMVEFICQEWNGDGICLKPELSFYSKEHLTTDRRPELRFLEEVVQKVDPCIDMNRFFRVPATRPCDARQEPPTREPPVIPRPQEGVCCQTYDEELLALMKTKEKTETEKLVIEKEVLELQKQLASMQIAMMRSGLFSPTQ